MIITTGFRTDLVRYYSEWLLNRFREGYVLARNPRFPNKVTRYELTPELVDCVVFDSKNYAPILARLHEITSRFSTYFYYTITAYGNDIEPDHPPIEKRVETLLSLSQSVGKERVAWRYSPVLLTQSYTVQNHIENFARIAGVVSPYVDRCILGFAEKESRIKSRIPSLVPLTPQDIHTLAKSFGSIAANYSLRVQTCERNGDFTHLGIDAKGCMTLDMLANANKKIFKNKTHKGARPGCYRIESRDIGAYHACPHGCKYCYSNNPCKALENYGAHDKNSPLLLGHPKETDIIQQGIQKSFLL